MQEQEVWLERLGRPGDGAAVAIGPLLVVQVRGLLCSAVADEII